MPRLDYRASPESELVSPEVRLVLAILLDEINVLRFWSGKPPLSEDTVRAKVRNYIRLHPAVPPQTERE